MIIIVHTKICALNQLVTVLVPLVNVILEGSHNVQHSNKMITEGSDMIHRQYLTKFLFNLAILLYNLCLQLVSLQ